MKRRIHIICGLLLVTLMAISAAHANLSKGDKAPDFVLPTIDGKETKFSEVRKDPGRKGANRVVLLDFWATWCPPCREEVPHLQRLHEKYGKKGLVVIGIAQDSDGAKSVKPFAEKNKLTYLQLVDVKRQVARAYKVGPIPTTYIIDNAGVIRSVHLGFAKGMEKQLEEEIKALLK